MIKYSRAMMEKFGKQIHQSRIDMGFLKRAIYWMIDSKFRKSVFLSKWLTIQVDNAPQDLKALAFTLTRDSHDKTIIEILKWVRQKITYVGDIEAWGMNEKWQTPMETFKLKTGDCEDGAILVYTLGTLAGIPKEQLFIGAGLVIGGGHAYIIYGADHDGVDRVIDWCYWFDSNAISNRMFYEDDKRYIEEWFRFNTDGSYKLKRR